jgi:hypothetical protein
MSTVGMYKQIMVFPYNGKLFDKEKEMNYWHGKQSGQVSYALG